MLHKGRFGYNTLLYKFLCQFNNDFHQQFHAFHYGVFEMAMAVKAAGAKVGAGQTHEGEASAIGTAAAGNDVAFDAQFFVYFGNIVHQEHMGLDHFTHVGVEIGKP